MKTLPILIIIAMLGVACKNTQSTGNTASANTPEAIVASFTEADRANAGCPTSPPSIAPVSLHWYADYECEGQSTEADIFKTNRIFFPLKETMYYTHYRVFLYDYRSNGTTSWSGSTNLLSYPGLSQGETEWVKIGNLFPNWTPTDGPDHFQFTIILYSRGVACSSYSLDFRYDELMEYPNACNSSHLGHIEK